MKKMLPMFSLALLLVLTAGPVAAKTGWGTGGNDDHADIDGSQSSNDHKTGSDGSTGSTPLYNVPKPYTKHTYVPTCGSNAPDGNDALCGAATMSCPKKGDIRYWVYTMKMGADDKPIDGDDASWKQETGKSVCLGPDDPRETEQPQITEEMIRDKAKSVAPKPVVHVEPRAKSYVNIPNNFYANDATTTKHVTVLGQDIAVKFVPTGFNWSFGDGGTATGPGIKQAKVGANGSVEHEYRGPRTYDITLKRSYEVTVSLPNGKNVTLDSPLQNSSDPYSFKIGEIQSIVTSIS